MRHLSMITLLGLFLSAAGCNGDASSDSGTGATGKTTTRVATPAAKGIGTLNSQQIFFALGFTAVLQDEERKLNESFLEVQKSKQELIEKKKKEIGEEPNDEQKKELQKLEVESAKTLQSVRARANRKLAERRRFLMNRFNDKTRGPIRVISERRNFAVVLVQPASIYAYASQSVDITGDVLDEIRRTDPSAIKVSLTRPQTPSRKPAPSRKPTPTDPAVPPSGDK